LVERSKSWRISELLTVTAEHLEKSNFENSRLNAERLLAHTLNLTRIDLYLNFDRPLTQPEVSQFRENVQRRLRHEPLQYIIGETEFFSLPFKVNPNVLVPRPETELLVETVIQYHRNAFRNKKEMRVLDLGTGSGCIAVALARNIDDAQILAVDISTDAIDIAQENARLNGVAERIDFVTGDAFELLEHNQTDKMDAIVSNPPYVAPTEYDNLPEEIRNYEPEVALKDGRDGLEFYRKIAKLAPRLLTPDGMLAVEVGMGQAQQVQEMFSQNELSSVQIINDLNDIQRVVRCRY